MSLPAREAERRSASPQPVRISPRRAAPPARTSAARPPNPNPPHPFRRARRGPHLRFWAFSLVVLASLTVGLVALNAMRIDVAYEAHVVEEQVRSMLEERRTLENDVARLSSPSRLGRWAGAHGLVNPAPGDVVILQVRGGARAGA